MYPSTLIVWSWSGPMTLTPADTTSRNSSSLRGGGYCLDNTLSPTHRREPRRVHTQKKKKSHTLKGKYVAWGRLPENVSHKEESTGKRLSSIVSHTRSRGQLAGGLTSGIRDRQQWLMTACCSLVPIIASTHSPQGLADGIKDHSPWRQGRMLEMSCAGPRLF